MFIQRSLGMFLVSSLPKMLSYRFLSTHLWEALVKNLEISGVPHSWSALLLL